MNIVEIVQTPSMVFLNLCIIMMIFLLMRKSLRYPYKVKNANKNISILLMFIFVLFSFWGLDWFHYLQIFIHVKEGLIYHLEDVYVWIIQNLSANYIVFRLIVWGSALVLFFMLIKRLPINKNVAIGIFGFIWMIWFSYARVSLVMLMVFLGFTLLYKPYKLKNLSYVLGFSLIVCAIFFHKTAIFAIGVGLLAFVFEKINRRLFVFLLFTFIFFLILIVKTSIDDFLEFNISENGMLEQVVKQGQYYANKEKTQNIGVGPSVMILFEVIPYYLIALQCYKVQFSSQYNKIPSSISFFIRLQLLIVLVSSIFLLDLGINTSSLYIRFLRFSIIPNVIVLSYFLVNKFYPKLTQNTLNLAIFSCFYTITYNIYCAYIRSGF